MAKIAIKNLPIEENNEYEIVINKVLNKDILIELNEEYYTISKPKNSSWKDIELFEGMCCLVAKKRYGENNEYSRLELIQVLDKKTTIKRKFKLPWN
ncbi:MAG: hypothetical protein Q9M36_10540 [Sulfurovum sp.]|nr:hypothetical protein [Sulfurovum sp.]